MTQLTLRKHQKDAVSSIENTLKDYNKCLVKMFCGTGKTRIVFHLMVHKKNNLTVIVFPSISLITQFNADYVLNSHWADLTKEFCYMSVCSKNELDHPDIHYTTESQQIETFLHQDKHKIVSVTYQSLETFVNVVEKLDIRIDLLVYDEAHHVIGTTIQNLVFKSKSFQEKTVKTIFLTATPKNENDIIMYDRDADSSDASDCGPLAFEYTHYQAVQDGICNDFDISIHLYTEPAYRNQNHYQSMSRSILASGNTRMLSFHYRSEAEHDTKSNVVDFISDKDKFITEFLHVQREEFPNKKIKKITLDGITGKTKNRLELLQKFEKTKCDEVFILASCYTIGEGVDTKNCNHIYFADPRTSYVSITQNIGRCVRKPVKDMPNATVSLHCFIDANRYEDCQTDEDRDTVIRQDMREGGNLNPILNVLSAVRQDDPDYYDLCLHYPHKYSPQEVKENFHKYGYSVGEPVGNLHETIEHLSGHQVDRNQDVDAISKELDKCIEIHSNSMEQPIQIYNPDSGDVLRVYYNDEEDKYYPVECTEKKPRNIERCRRKPFKINIHTNQDVKVLWKISGELDLTKKICQAYLSCTVKEDNWFQKCDELVLFLEKEKRRPRGQQYIKQEIAQLQKANGEQKEIACLLKEVELSSWNSNQIHNYKNRKQAMKDLDKRQYFETRVLAPYEELYLDGKEKWRSNLRILLSEYLEKGKRPRGTQYIKPEIKALKSEIESNTCTDEERTAKQRQLQSLLQEKEISHWNYCQIRNYKTREQIMMEPDIRKEWEEQVVAPYSKWYLDRKTIWRNKLNILLTEFLEQGRKWRESKTITRRINALQKELESSHFNEAERTAKAVELDNLVREKEISLWNVTQVNNYKRQTEIMAEPDIRTEWETKVLTPYKELYCDDRQEWRKEQWRKNLILLTEFLTQERRRPRPLSMIKGEIETLQRELDNDNLDNGCITTSTEKAAKQEQLTRLKKEGEIGVWNCTQIHSYKNKENIMADADIRTEWETNVLEPYKELYPEDRLLWRKEQWRDSLRMLVHEFLEKGKKPRGTQYIKSEIESLKTVLANTSSNVEWIAKKRELDNLVQEKEMSYWNTVQLRNYKNREYMMADQEIRSEWEQHVQRFQTFYPKFAPVPLSLEQPTPKRSKSITKQVLQEKEKEKDDVSSEKQSDQHVGGVRNRSKLSELHQKYKTLRSDHLHQLFEETPELWHEYHSISEQNELSFQEQDEIPHKRIIKYLEQIKSKRQIHVADLGCGKGKVADHFKTNSTYTFYNYDHVSTAEHVVKCDISKLPLDENEIDICILCLSMWGSNCEEYLKEVYRVLVHNGILLIIEPTKRWITEETNKLKELLEQNGFMVKKVLNQDKFMFLEVVRG